MSITVSQDVTKAYKTFVFSQNVTELSTKLQKTPHKIHYSRFFTHINTTNITQLYTTFTKLFAQLYTL